MSQVTSDPSRRFVLLDRDGTVIVPHHYLSDPEKVELLPRAAEGLRALRSMGFGLALMTNQSAIGRGYFDRARLVEIHDRLEECLIAEDLTVDGIYFCPHRPEEGCACRKPGTGLVAEAVRDHGFVPSDSFVIGDNVCDIEMGQACGATTILVRTGYGRQVLRERTASPDHVVDDLVEAARVIRVILASPGADNG